MMMINRVVFVPLFALTSSSSGSAFVAPRTTGSISSSSYRSKLVLAMSEDPMAAYDRAMAQGGATAPAAASAPPAVNAPPAVSAPPAVPAAATPPAPVAPAAATGGGSTPADAIATLDASQQGSVAAIAAAIPDLAVKPDLAWMPEDGVTIAGCPATLDARDAAGPANIAWLASLCIAGKESSLTIFNGPLTDVPHLLSRCCVVNDNTLSFSLDFRPRAYGAYEMKDAAGNYPGPDELGRAAFEYSGARNDYFNKFVTEGDVQAFLESTKASLEGAVDSAETVPQEELLTRGPNKLSVTCPLTPGNVAAIAAAREKAASYWLGWATDGQHTHKPGAPINTQYVYDSKYKINAYGALLPIYSALYGPEDGARLTAAESGPLDEAYVGGGS